MLYIQKQFSTRFRKKKKIMPEENYDDPIKDAEQKFTDEVQPKILQWLQ